MVGSPENLGYLNVEALDLRGTMFWDTPVGVVSFTPNVSIFTKYEFPRGSIANATGMCPPSGPNASADDVCDGVGRDVDFAETAIQSIPRWSGTFATSLGFGPHNIRLTPRYTDGINQVFPEDVSADDQLRFVHQDGIWTVDLNYFWTITAASGLNLSVRNLFAEDPPTTSGGNQAFFNRNRRTYSIQFTHSFAN